MAGFRGSAEAVTGKLSRRDAVAAGALDHGLSPATVIRTRSVTVLPLVWVRSSRRTPPSASTSAFHRTTVVAGTRFT